MIKSSFYTMVRENNKNVAKLIVNGYSDGTFYYYKNDYGTWWAIHPLCGMAVARGNTRKEAASVAYSEGVQRALDDMYKNRMDYYKRIGAAFDAAVLELKQEAANNG
jgi:hypothetical protein